MATVDSDMHNNARANNSSSCCCIIIKSDVPSYPYSTTFESVFS